VGGNSKTTNRQFARRNIELLIPPSGKLKRKPLTSNRKCGNIITDWRNAMKGYTLVELVAVMAGIVLFGLALIAGVIYLAVSILS
jgi:hypothetical protein